MKTLFGFDLRYEYRVLKMFQYETLYMAQCKRWWWPFWTRIDTDTHAECVRICFDHANPPPPPPKPDPAITYLGKLPPL